jgi:pimeloyl-ACP methyl ester carboxylesterase
MDSGLLDVPGASLYFETGGHGILLLFIPGANGDAEIFRPVAEHLQESFTVAIYDRRGFSRSSLRGPQDYEHRLETDADDVRRLIQHLSDQPAIIFGTSSGAIVALQVVTRHPSVVRLMVCHEPPAVNLLPEPESAKWRAFFTDVYDTYHKEGMQQGMQKFSAGVLGVREAHLLKERRTTSSGDDKEGKARGLRNLTYWYENEIRQYTSVDLDQDELARLSHQILLAGGYESKDQMPYLPNTALAKRFGASILDLPGGHLGYAFYPIQFAQELASALSRVESLTG